LSSERLPALDGLRATSILLVLSCHMLPLGPKALQFNAAAGAMGMSLFFALSGFLIVSGLRHNADVPEFLVRRLTRIVPLAYLYTFIFFGILFFDPKTMLWMMSFLLNFRDQTSPYNAHFWSLCVEVHFYLSIAVVVAIAGKRGLWIVWPACLAITALRISVGENAYYNIETHLRIDEILSGACVATLYQKSWSDRPLVPTWAVVLAALSWFASSTPFTGWFQFMRPYATALLLASVISHGGSPISAFLATRFMRYIATISYALYVIHPATIQGWWNEGSTFDRYVLKRPISFLMTFVAAHISTFHWEHFWMQVGRQWIKQRRARRALQSAT
jgi:peptidoglycan/LPS O-acetylase OafA/YrhL